MKPDRAGAADAALKGAVGGQSPGQMLRQERERRGWTVQQAAEDLNLDRWIVEAIEVDHFVALGAPVYARGHLRKYAALLGLSPDLVVGCYDALSGTPAAPVVTPTTSARTVSRKKRAYFLPLLLAVASAVVVGAWWLFAQSGSDGHTSMDAAMPAGPASPVGVIAAPLSTPATPTVVDSGAPSTASAASTRNLPAPDGSKQVNLRLEFTSPAWAEVYDAAGQRLMFEVGQPGQPRSLRGVAPLQVVIGVAGAVTAQVDDRAIVIPRRTGRDSTRFVIAADGSVR